MKNSTPNSRCDSELPSRATRRQFLGYTGAGVLATLLPGCGSDGMKATQYPRTIAMGQEIIENTVDRSAQPVAAVSIAMLKDSRVVWQQAFGLSSVPNGTLTTTQTRFNIGSVSKVIAALAVAILQDRGLISLDTPVVHYLPSFTMLSPEYARITTRHLLSHSSGLPGTNLRNIFTFSPIPDYAADTQSELAFTHLKHSPGELAVYCNDGFTMIERIVLSVTGQSFISFVNENIFVPLAMTNSGYLASVPNEGLFSYPYVKGTQYQEFVNAYATGGVSSTPGDMMNFAQMLIDRGMFEGQRIVSAAGIAEMGADQTAGLSINPSPEWRWGLGWDSVQQPALAAAGVLGWEKDGGTAFYTSEFIVVPHAKLAVMVTGNTGYDARKLAESIVLSALEEDGTIRELPPKVSIAPPAAASGPSIASAAGIYANSDSPLQVLVNSDNSLQLNQWDGAKHGWAQVGTGPYRYRSDGWWWSNSDPFSYRFAVVSRIGEDGKMYSYRYLMKRVVPGAGYAFLTLPIGQQLAALEPLDSVWEQRLGTQWRVTNDSQTAVSVVMNGEQRAVLTSLAELPGYFLYGNDDLRYQVFVPLADDRGGMSVKVPGNYGRDLYEIRFVVANNLTTVTLGSSTYVRV
ncbi:beta-lactamase family protein [Caballeronia sp. EK]|uniref:serine hydrolase domain-containing protein n=1 Tax=Caballeronia sp. EK TaxID=2767469 RepID=UPI00165544A0|nr:serine hydrolase domain-containing protein [Caballeronia sp. EK]MBC8642024.1 beta-lactamase family protein [Caballeronia sp. EK]